MCVLEDIFLTKFNKKYSLSMQKTLGLLCNARRARSMLPGKYWCGELWNMIL